MSVYVTDTHSLVWYFTQQRKKLSRRALTAFEQAEDSEAFIYIPAVALWEISRHEQLGVINLNVATARLKDLPLITKDQAITGSGIVEVCW